MIRANIAIAITIAFVGCKSDSAIDAGPAASSSASSAASASASASSAPSTITTYAGTYTATAGTLYVPDAAAWDGVKFRGDNGDAGALGEGKLTLTFDSASGAVSGDLDGPLGPATITGVGQEKSVMFHVAPKQPGDLAFSGTGSASIDGDKISGEVHVSSWRANVLRDATFEAKKK